MKSYFVFIIPLVAGILIVLVASALAAGAPEQKRRFYNRVTLWTSIVVLLLSALLTLPLIPGTRLFGDSFLVTDTARSFAVVFLLLTALVVLLTDGYFAKVHVNGNDWRLIVLCMSLGAVHLIFANKSDPFRITGISTGVQYGSGSPIAIAGEDACFTLVQPVL